MSVHVGVGLDVLYFAHGNTQVDHLALSQTGSLMVVYYDSDELDEQVCTIMY